MNVIFLCRLFCNGNVTWLKENRNSVQLLTEGDEQYVEFFRHLLSKAGLGEEVTKEVTDFRNNAFHDDLV